MNTRRIISVFIALSFVSVIQYKSGLCAGFAKTAFSSEAERAYRSIIEYDENAPVTYDEIKKLYLRDRLCAPLQKAFDKIGFLLLSAKLAFDPDGYALYAVYSGKRTLFRPEGVIGVSMYLMPFTDEEARLYDALFEKGGTIPQTAFREAVERAEEAMKKGLASENGFEPYLDTFDEIPVSENAAFLSEEAINTAFALKTPGEISPPVLDARGVLFIRLIGLTET